jgi:uncharacterized membrane protein YoaK (UPF0700 family)
MTQRRSLLPYFLVPALPLLLPLVAMRFTDEVQWSGFDFAVAYVLFAGAGFAYRLATTRAGNLLYRGAAALAVFACLSLVWVNLAVGFIGNEDNPANLMYLGVLATAVLGSIASRLEARGMSLAMSAAGAVQFLVPIVAWFVWRPNFDQNVTLIFFLNTVWVFMFVISGLLFRQAADQAKPA